jgi:hypothetical protein
LNDRIRLPRNLHQRLSSNARKRGHLARYARLGRVEHGFPDGPVKKGVVEEALHKARLTANGERGRLRVQPGEKGREVFGHGLFFRRLHGLFFAGFWLLGGLGLGLRRGRCKNRHGHSPPDKLAGHGFGDFHGFTGFDGFPADQKAF